MFCYLFIIMVEYPVDNSIESKLNIVESSDEFILSIVEASVELKPNIIETYVDLKSDVAYKENMFDHNVPKLGDNEVDMTKYFFLQS